MLYQDPAATLGDLREAVTTLEEIERIARRVLGGVTIRSQWELRESCERASHAPGARVRPGV